AVCFFSMVLYAAYLGFGSRNRAIPSIYLYVVPVYLAAGFFCLLVALAAGAPSRSGRLGPRHTHELLMVLGWAVFPTVAGHSIINWAFKHLRGQVVSILNLGQFIFAGVIGFFLLGDVPTPAFYGAAVLAVGGALIVLRRPPSGGHSPTASPGPN